MSEQFNVNTTLNSICEEVVFLDIDDKKCLGRVLNGIEELKTWAEEKGYSNAKIILDSIVSILESLILDETENPEEEIEKISKAVSEIQKMVENNYSDESLNATYSPPKDKQKVAKKDDNEIIDDTIISDFIIKLKIELDEYDELLINYEKTGESNLLDELKRKIHNLKGESVIVGITDIEKLCHKTEDLLSKAEVVDTDLLFKFVDYIKNKVRKMEGEPVELIDVEKLIAQFDPSNKIPKNIVSDLLPENVDEDIFADFLSKQVSVMEDLENNILKINGKNNKHPKAEINRILHTIKGEANLMGLARIGEICHESESYIAENESISDFLFVLKDWLSESFEYYSGIRQQLPGEEKIEIFFSSSQKEDTVLEPIDDMELLQDFLSEADEHLETANTEMLSFEATGDLEKINAIFRAFHTIKGVAGFLNLNDVRILSHNAEDLLDKIRKKKIDVTDNITDVVYKSIDKLKELMLLLAEYAQKGVKPPPDPSVQKIIKEVTALLAGDEMQEYAEEISAKPATTPVILESPAEKERFSTGKKNLKIKENIKVDAARLDHLIDFIGELAIAASMLTQSEEIKNIGSAELMKKMNRLDKITKEVQSTSMSLRMVTVRSTFQKMARLVRDLSKKSGKEVEFSMHGEDTELDKNVVEQIGDPLVHLIRNAVDHGIESNAEDRIRQNKSKEGHVELRAFHKGGNIYIEIEDDGKGLDKDAILAKAIEKEIISPNAKLANNEVWNLIFEPGFSTAKKVTDVSGRGVGMDVVKKNIEAMRGHVNIKSEKGKGSVFSIILPLTLAIIDGMVIKIGNERYIIPTLSVITSVNPKKDQYYTAVGKGEMIKFQDNFIPLFRLSDHFGIPGSVENVFEGIVVIVESGMKKLGVLVDELLGQQQIVIKSLKGEMKDIKGISGGAIMPDGTVALILDIGGVIDLTTIKRNEVEVSK